MAIQKIDLDIFLTQRFSSLVIDVRSPAEFTYAHVPGAVNLPLFNDEERAVVGTAYKQQSREKAIKIGLDFFGPKMRAMVEQVEKWNKDKTKKVVVHCWRGGMRSSGVAWLLDLYGFEVYQLVGGYKTYRNWIVNTFEKEFQLKILGGFTGSGKTYILQELAQKNVQMVDLEALACHKGSALGGINMPEQPSQEMFENLLAEDLNTKNLKEIIFLEDESNRIGNRTIPLPLWKNMKKSDLFYMHIDAEKRLEFLVDEYGSLPKDKLLESVMRITKRLGGLETQLAITALQESNFKACFEILLKYYDKYYYKSLLNKSEGKTIEVKAEKVDAKINTNKIIELL